MQALARGHWGAFHNANDGTQGETIKLPEHALFSSGLERRAIAGDIRDALVDILRFATWRSNRKIELPFSMLCYERVRAGGHLQMLPAGGREAFF